MFAPAWSTRTAEQDPGATFMNGTTKYVVSSTLREPRWKETVFLGGYDPGTIANLKKDVDGALYVSGSGTLVRGMLDDDLVDELHLFAYPVSLGVGPRLFADGAAATKWTLKSSEAYANGVLYTSYVR